MTTHDHSEGIRLQAERVVRAYKEMRDTTNSANLKSDDSPVGLFAELMQQIRMLEGWLEPRPDLHAETVAELREEHRDADEREIKLRVAIRESIGMTRDEEDAAYDRISKAMRP